MPHALLSLLALYPPTYPNRGGSMSETELFVGIAILVAVIVVPLIQTTIAIARRQRLVERAMALPRKAPAGVNGIFAAKVTSGDSQVDLVWERPAVWFAMTLTASNPPPGETAPEPITLTHHGRCELSAELGTLDVDPRRVSLMAIRETELRNVTPDKLPAPLRALLRERNAPVLWKTGRTVQWSLRASAIHLDDELMVIGNTKPTPEPVETRDNSESSTYRDAPLQPPRPVWKLDSGPGRDRTPVLTGAIPETLATVLDKHADELDARWFGVD